MKKRWIQNPETLELVPAEDYVPPERGRGPAIIPDIPVHVALAAGAPVEITGRAAQREYMRRNNLVLHEDLKGLPPRVAHKPHEVKGMRESMLKAMAQMENRFRGR